MQEEKSSDFVGRVKNIVKKIPKGKTLSYGEVARLSGNPSAARAVARIMSANFDPEIPCHRVIRADGTAGGYNRGDEKVKKRMLMRELQQVNTKRQYDK